MVQLFRGRGQQKPQPGTDKSATRLLPETTWASEPMPSGIPPAGRAVVTISRQFGSGGAEVGRILSQMSGLNYVDHEIIDEVARRMGVNAELVAHQDEQTSSTIGHILDAMQLSNPFVVNYSTLFGQKQGATQSDEEAYFYLTQKVVLELATEGNVVIIGRGSQFLLHNIPRTLHIYIFAPLDRRIENITQHFQLDRKQAADLIEQRDYEHDMYLRHNYGNDGHDPALYHLLINTGLFSYETAASLIHQALSLAQKIGS
jgi:CMP/dCMP kinase